MVAGATLTTATTVASARISITAPAKAGQRVFLISASYTTDLANGTLNISDGTTQIIESTTTAANATVTSAALFGTLEVGMRVSGDNIAANTFVNAITDTSTITISVNATGSNTQNLTYTGRSKFQIKTEARGVTFKNYIFRPAIPIPISSSGVAAYFDLGTTTTGRLSVAYGYAI